MFLSYSTPSAPGHLTVNRTKAEAEDDMAVQVFLTGSYTAMYLSVAEARTLAERLLAATAETAVEVTA